MNWDRIEGNWKQFKGRVQERWGELSDGDLDRIEGKWERLEGALQERYGIAREQAERQIREWLEEVEEPARS